MRGDNQRNTCLKVRLLVGGATGVISIWDESPAGFEAWRLLRNPNAIRK